jgi:hypothetical protein
MFNVGDYVLNPKTKHFGQVVGYGHQILNSGYETTLRVLVTESETCHKRALVEEDLYSVWVQWSGLDTSSSG